MTKLIHFSDGTIKTDKGVPIIVVGENEQTRKTSDKAACGLVRVAQSVKARSADYQDKENEEDAGCEY